MIVDELNNITRRFNRKNISSITEAQIYTASDKYSIKLRNGAIIKRVPGPSGLKPGDYVVVTKTSGINGFYTILQKSYTGFNSILTVAV